MLDEFRGEVSDQETSQAHFNNLSAKKLDNIFFGLDCGASDEL